MNAKRELKELLKITTGYIIIALCAIPYSLIGILIFGVEVDSWPVWGILSTLACILISGYFIIKKFGGLGHSFIRKDEYEDG